MENSQLTDLLKNQVNTGELPRYIYKFRPINNNLYSIIRNNHLWFSKPSCFNDPFDTQLSYNAEFESFARMVEYVDTFHVGRPAALRSRVLNFINNDPVAYKETIYTAISTILSSKGICCFSTILENLLLWAIYADSHNGVCLKFDLLADPSFFLLPFVIKYQKEYPNYNFCKNPNGVVDVLMKTKAICWEHEKEIRIIKDSAGFFKFNKESLVEIIFGCRCESKQMKKIIKIANRYNYPNLSYMKAEVKNNEFGLYFNPA